MVTDFEHPLKAVSLRVLSDWAMTLADEVARDQAKFDPAKPLYMAWVDVKGNINGALSIVAQEDFMNVIANNLLGSMDDETTKEEQQDALREMSNVLAGNFFTEAFGEHCVFDLLNPNVGEVPYSELERIGQRSVKFYFVADDTPAVVTFSVKK